MKNFLSFCCLALCCFCLFCCKNEPSSLSSASSGGLGSKKISPFTGFWEWTKATDESTFSLEISEYQDSLEGAYCAVTGGGEKIDCGEAGELAFSLPKPKSMEFETWFQNYFTGDSGRVKITLRGTDTLIWKIIEAPKGEHYALPEAVLVRSAKSDEE